jgi:hypothetical protein
MRKEGRTFQEIADALGFAGRQGAYECVAAALRELPREGAEELRALDAERLDTLWRASFPAALEGDLAALDACLKILARRSRLLGLDAAAQKETPEAPAPTAVMLVPVFQSADDWERAAVAQQQRLKADVRG